MKILSLERKLSASQQGSKRKYLRPWLSGISLQTLELRPWLSGVSLQTLEKELRPCLPGISLQTLYIEREAQTTSTRRRDFIEREARLPGISLQKLERRGAQAMASYQASVHRLQRKRSPGHGYQASVCRL